MKNTIYLWLIVLLVKLNLTSSNCGFIYLDGCEGILPCFLYDQIFPFDCQTCYDDSECPDLQTCHGLGVCRGRFDETRYQACSTRNCSSCWASNNENNDFWCGCEPGQTCAGDYQCSDTKLGEPVPYFGICVPEPFPRGGGAPCLSAHSTVQLRDKEGAVNVGNLKQGDFIATSAAGDDTGDLVYEKMYSFGHLNHYVAGRFLQIETNSAHTKSAAPLEITAEHLLYKYEASVPGGVPVRADNIRVGDFIIGDDNGTKERVTKVSTIQRAGIYSPVVKGGVFLSGGVKVSSYTTAGCASCGTDPQYLKLWNVPIISHHMLSHMAISPYRILCHDNGDEKSLCINRNVDGQLLFASFGEEWVSFVLEQGMIGSTVAVLAFSFMILPLYALEQLGFGTSASIIVSMTIFVLGFLIRVRKARVVKIR